MSLWLNEPAFGATLGRGAKVMAAVRAEAEAALTTCADDRDKSPCGEKREEQREEPVRHVEHCAPRVHESEAEDSLFFCHKRHNRRRIGSV
jgi:hypothetical protein